MTIVGESERPGRAASNHEHEQRNQVDERENGRSMQLSVYWCCAILGCEPSTYAMQRRVRAIYRMSIPNRAS